MRNLKKFNTIVYSHTICAWQGQDSDLHLSDFEINASLYKRISPLSLAPCETQLIYFPMMREGPLIS